MYHKMSSVRGSPSVAQPASYGITTPLPLPGEFVVVQLAPVAMAKHYSNTTLRSELSRYTSRKYLAVMYRYLEGISPSKPWHMCQLHLFYGLNPPLRPLHGDIDCHSSPPSEPHVEDEEDSYINITRRRNRLPPSATCKPRQMVQLIVARIRTRRCALPRTDFHPVPEEVFGQMRSTFVVMESPEEMKSLNRYVECHRYLMERAPYISILPFRQDAQATDPVEVEAGTPQLRLCLLPHLEYSFDLSAAVVPGKHLIEEHSRIFSTLVRHVPEMPLKAMLPINIVDVNFKDYSTLSTSPQSTSPSARSAKIPSPRSGSIPEYSDLMNPFGYEKPTDEILVIAPPPVDATSVSPLGSSKASQLLRSFVHRLMHALKPARFTTGHCPDDRPYVPFSDWDDLIANQSQLEWSYRDDYNIDD